MRSHEELAADDWWDTLSSERRVQVYRWVAQRSTRSTDDPDAYDTLIELPPAPLLRSKAASAQYDVTCRTCAAPPRQPCRTRRTGRVTDTHAPRLTDAAAPVEAASA